MLFLLEAFDLSEKGFDTPFSRRQMTILDKVLNNSGIMAEKILEAFSEKSRHEIYPALSTAIMPPIIEELTLMGYPEITDGRAMITRKGCEKLKAFKSVLSNEEREMLDI